MVFDTYSAIKVTVAIPAPRNQEDLNTLVLPDFLLNSSQGMSDLYQIAGLTLIGPDVDPQTHESWREMYIVSIERLADIQIPWQPYAGGSISTR